jgi:hypothetical protein
VIWPKLELVGARFGAFEQRVIEQIKELAAEL